MKVSAEGEPEVDGDADTDADGDADAEAEAGAGADADADADAVPVAGDRVEGAALPVGTEVCWPAGEHASTMASTAAGPLADRRDNATSP